MAGRIEVVLGDITTQDVDAIVNAANERMLGGGGVDGAIHRAAGPGLLDECRRVDEVRPGVRCPTGHAHITGGHDLPARHVIHTVGPVWHGGAHDEPQLLADCYRNSLALAASHGISSIAFPAISTGVYGYPPDRACRVALDAIIAFLGTPAGRSIERVVLCCFDERTLRLYQTLLDVSSTR